MINYILYMLAIMIFWDFSLHVIELAGQANRFFESKSIFSYYYPHFHYKKTPGGLIERENWRNIYQRFWVTYWGTALVLMIIYIIFK